MCRLEELYEFVSKGRPQHVRKQIQYLLNVVLNSNMIRLRLEHLDHFGSVCDFPSFSTEKDTTFGPQPGWFKVIGPP